MIKKNRRHVMRHDDLILFFKQLDCLISAGTTLSQSLVLLTQTQAKKEYQTIIQTLYDELENGKEFYHALQRFPRSFDMIIRHFIRIGEQTGTLDTMLKRICNYLEKKYLLYRQLKQACIYPVLLIIAALMITFMMLYYVVPQFTEIFSQLPNKLPLMTRFIIRLSQLLHQKNIWLIIIFIISICMIIIRTLICSVHWQTKLLRLPYIGHLMQKIMLVQLTRNLSTMLAAAVPLTQALILVATLFQYTVLKESIYSLYAEVNAGKRFHISLAIDPFYPSLLIQMIKIGETAGTLEQMLNKFADLYETDIQQSINILSRLLEPLIITIVGVLIGVIVIAMYLPLFQLGTLI